MVAWLLATLSRVFSAPPPLSMLLAVPPSFTSAPLPMTTAVVRPWLAPLRTRRLLACASSLPAAALGVIVAVTATLPPSMRPSASTLLASAVLPPLACTPLAWLLARPTGAFAMLPSLSMTTLLAAASPFSARTSVAWLRIRPTVLSVSRPSTCRALALAEPTPRSMAA